MVVFAVWVTILGSWHSMTFVKRKTSIRVLRLSTSVHILEPQMRISEFWMMQSSSLHGIRILPLVATMETQHFRNQSSMLPPKYSLPGFLDSRIEQLHYIGALYCGFDNFSKDGELIFVADLQICWIRVYWYVTQNFYFKIFRSHIKTSCLMQ